MSTAEGPKRKHRDEDKKLYSFTLSHFFINTNTLFIVNNNTRYANPEMFVAMQPPPAVEYDRPLRQRSNKLIFKIKTGGKWISLAGGCFNVIDLLHMHKHIRPIHKKDQMEQRSTKWPRSQWVTVTGRRISRLTDIPAAVMPSQALQPTAPVSYSEHQWVCSKKKTKQNHNSQNVKRSPCQFSTTHLYNEIPPTEVSDGARQACAAPDEPQEQRPLCVGERLHHFPEPLDERRCRLHPFVGGHWLQQVEGDIWASTHLRGRQGVCLLPKSASGARTEALSPTQIHLTYHCFQLVTGEERQQRNRNHSGHALTHCRHLLVKLVQPAGWRNESHNGINTRWHQKSGALLDRAGFPHL